MGLDYLLFVEYEYGYIKIILVGYNVYEHVNRIRTRVVFNPIQTPQVAILALAKLLTFMICS